MISDNFRYMRRGKQIADLTSEDLKLLQPINLRGKEKKNALLVLHGFSSSPAVYRYLIPNLKNYDAIVCPVLPGHGHSIDAFSQSKASDWLLAAQQACEELFQNYKTVDVLGLSLGGLLACELSKTFAIHHLFLLAPALKLHMNLHLMIPLAKILQSIGFQHLRNTAGNLLSNVDAEIAYRKLPVSAIIEMLSLAHHYKWVAPTCPVDLFLGTYDEVVASKEVEQLFLSLTNVTIHWLTNSAHVLPIDNDYKEIIDCINNRALTRDR